MQLIKRCPSCNKKIRFPINTGKIEVTCQCGYSFIADPDDTALYRDAVFDLKTSRTKKNRNSIIQKLFNIISSYCR